MIKSHVTRFLSRAIELQSILMTFSVPFLVGWGMQIPLLGIIGNIIFTPFLAVFLFVSSLVFFSELLYIPNSYLIVVLEYVQRIWTCSLAWSSRLFSAYNQWLMLEVPAPPLAVLVIMFCLAILVLLYRFEKPVCRTYAFLCLFVFYIGVLNLFCGRRTALITRVFQSEITGREVFKLMFIKHKKNLICVDPGINAQSRLDWWLERQALGYMRKTCGTARIDHLIFLKPSRVLHVVAQTLCQDMTCRHIWLPDCSGYMPKSICTSINLLRVWARENGCMLHEITCTYDLSSFLSKIACDTQKLKIILEPMGSIKRTSRCVHAAWRVRGIVGEQPFMVTPLLTPREQVLPLPPQVK